MHISSKKELVDLILGNKVVETIEISSEKEDNEVNTIFKNVKKDKERFFRIRWGEVLDENGVPYLWYDSKAEEVFYDKYTWAKGWKSKKEIKAISLDNSRKRDKCQMNDCIVNKVEKNIVTKDNSPEWVKSVLTKNKPDEVKYALEKTAEALVKGETVLYFSTDLSENDIKKRLVRKVVKVLKEKDKVSNDNDILNYIKKARKIINNGDIKVYKDVTVEENYIIDKIKSEKNGNPMLAIVDHLELVIDDRFNNYDKVIDIHKKIDFNARLVNANVLINTQIVNPWE